MSHHEEFRPPRLPIVETGPGRSARFQAAAVRASAAILRRFDGRGIARSVEKIASGFSRTNYVVLDIDGARLKIDLSDAYWLGPLLRKEGYEPEVVYVFLRLMTGDDALLDCGANIGYWSALSAQRLGRPGSVVAIEASSLMFRRLVENAALNGGAFRPVHAAVWRESGNEVEVAVDAQRHSWASADPSVARTLTAAGFHSERVETITIDDAVERYMEADPAMLFVKVDVEGSEMDAFAGAERTLERPALFTYEDHGRSEDSAVTEFLLARGDIGVFYCTPEFSIIEIHEGEEARHLKRERGRGYNFFACKREIPMYRTLRSLSVK